MKTLALLVVASALAGAAMAQDELDQTYVWTHVSEGDAHYLSWAVPESDDVGMQFRCPRPASGRVELSAFNVWDGEGARPQQITLSSSGVRATPSGRIEENEMTGYAFEGTLPADSPVMAAFGRTGALTLRSDAETEQANARSAAERRAIKTFLELCRRAAR